MALTEFIDYFSIELILYMIVFCYRRNDKTLLHKINPCFITLNKIDFNARFK